MTDYAKPPVKPAWAEGGDRSDEPSNAEIQEGWPNSNTPPTRQRFNWIQNWFGNAIRYFMQMGISHWDAAEDYRLGSRVQKADGSTWKAMRANTNVQPGTSLDDWQPWGDVNLDQDLNLYSAGAVARFLRLNKGTSSAPGAALKQWEVGANTSGNLVFRAYNDAGALLGDALVFDRASGLLTLQEVDAQTVHADTLDLGGVGKVTNMAAGTAGTDGVNKTQMDAADSAIVRMSSVEGLSASRTGTTNLSLSAEAVRLRDAAGNMRWNGATGGLVINTANQGANGRDQAGNFTSQWVHAYIIWGAAVAVAGLVSASSTAPTLPAGYTHFAYAFPVRIGATANTPAVTFRCLARRIEYNWDVAPFLFGGQVTGVHAMTGWPTFVAPNAEEVEVQGNITFRADGAGNFDGYVTVQYPGDGNNSLAWVSRQIGMAANSDNTQPIWGTLMQIGLTPNVAYALSIGGGYVYASVSCRAFTFRSTV